MVHFCFLAVNRLAHGALRLVLKGLDVVEKLLDVCDVFGLNGESVLLALGGELLVGHIEPLVLLLLLSLAEIGNEEVYFCIIDALLSLKSLQVVEQGGHVFILLFGNRHVQALTLKCDFFGVLLEPSLKQISLLGTELFQVRLFE